MRKLILSAALIAALAACSSQPTKPKPAAVEERTPPPSMSQGATTTAQPTPMRLNSDPLHDPNNILSKRSVYFDYDSFIVKEEYRPLVTAHSKYLSDHRPSQVKIEGNADERGSTEYNLALGQKRADAVKKVMELLGVPDNQIESISNGKEKPKNPGHDEAAWAENRRADVVYQGER